MATYKIRMVRDLPIAWTELEADANVNDIPFCNLSKEEKCITVKSSSCCEACVLAIHSCSGFVPASWEEVEEAEEDK